MTIRPNQSARTFARNAAFALVAGATALGGIAAPAFAQRDPAYASARASGEVGEKMDGYIGIVGAETPALRRIVNDINIKRRAVYSEKAQAARATLEEYAFAAGCRARNTRRPTAAGRRAAPARPSATRAVRNRHVRDRILCSPVLNCTGRERLGAPISLPLRVDSQIPPA